MTSQIASTFFSSFRVLLIVGLTVAITACGNDPPTAPSATTASISVTVNSPIRMGQTAQASGTALRSNGQSQPITSGWQSDAPSIATVTDAGLVTGIANGRATVYVISGGQQGQQVVRVVPDYQGSWNGGLRVTACTQTGTWATIDFCGNFPVGSIDGYSLSLAQSGDQLTARLSYGSSIVFPSVATPIGADGSASFSATYVNSSNGITIDANVLTNSLRVGELTGTVNEVWHQPGVSGEARLAQDIVGTTHTSATALTVGAGGSSGKPRVLDRFAAGRR